MFKKIYDEIKSFSAKERLFVLAAMLCGFLISAEYAISRPVSNSVFITAYGAKFFPYVWLALVPFNFLIVSLYNRYLPRLGCLKMFLCIAGVVISGNLFCGLFLQKIHSLPFLFYIWKEVYIMLMFQQLWSIIHATISTERAKYLYGIIFGIGGLGGAIGSMIPGFCAVKIGSESLLFFTLPLYILLIALFSFLLKQSDQNIHNIKTKETPPFLEGIKLLASSRYLIFILLLVLFMQVASAIIDYQFNHFLEKNILDKDLRTEYVGRLVAVINSSTVILQFIGTFLLVKFLGLRMSHFLIPLVLCVNSIGLLFFPIFGMISLSYVTIKAFDFSLFGIVKEMLYLPLSIKEKFRAKAVIDVFAYRTSKGIASSLILLFQFLAGASLLHLLTWTSILLFISWSSVVALMFKKSLEIKPTSL